MPWELYWHGDPWAVRAYREADRLAAERRDRDLWLQGRYVYDAMLCAAPLFMTFHKTHRPHDYLEAPYTQLERERERRREEREYENGLLAAQDIARWAQGVVKAQEEARKTHE